jgi:hypothetical protein
MLECWVGICYEVSEILITSWHYSAIGFLSCVIWDAHLQLCGVGQKLSVNSHVEKTPSFFHYLEGSPKIITDTLHLFDYVS